MTRAHTHTHRKSRKFSWHVCSRDLQILKHIAIHPSSQWPIRRWIIVARVIDLNRLNRCLRRNKGYFLWATILILTSSSFSIERNFSTSRIIYLLRLFNNLFTEQANFPFFLSIFSLLHSISKIRKLSLNILSIFPSWIGYTRVTE